MSDFFFYFGRELTLFLPRLGSRFYYEGMDLVPPTGPALLLSNHIAHFDPPFSGNAARTEKPPSGDRPASSSPP